MIYFVTHFQVFLLIMIRLVAMMTVAPFYSSGVIPFRLRAAVGFMVALVIYPVITAKGYRLPDGMGPYAVLAFQEALIGIYIGFLVSALFSAFQLAGQFFAVQAGFGISEVLDPLGQESIPLIGQLQNLIGLLVFFAIDGHHYMIEAVYRSFELAPVFSIAQSAQGGFVRYLVYSFSGMFLVALKLSLPIVATIFLMTLSEGILAKAAPQMNIMMLGLPFRVAVSVGLMAVATPLLVRIMHVSLERSFNFLTKVLLHWPV